MQLPVVHTDILIHCSKYLRKNSFELTVTVRDDYTTREVFYFYVFLVPKKFISGEVSAEKILGDIFIAPKDSSLNFRGSLVSYFRAIMLIFAVMRISEDFGSPLPARPVAVKSGIH